MLIFAACVFLHDDGHPDSISDSEKAYVLTMCEQSDQQIVLVINRMEQFITDPENPIERADALTEALTDWFSISDEIVQAPEFYYDVKLQDQSDFAIQYRSINERILSREDALHEASDLLAQDIIDRSDSIDLDHESFSKLRAVLGRTLEPPASGPCDHRTCFWCRARYAWLKRNSAGGFSAN